MLRRIGGTALLSVTLDAEHPVEGLIAIEFDALAIGDCADLGVSYGSLTGARKQGKPPCL